jgi:hypothetical protein
MSALIPRVNGNVPGSSGGIPASAELYSERISIPESVNIFFSISLLKLGQSTRFFPSLRTNISGCGNIALRIFVLEKNIADAKY